MLKDREEFVFQYHLEKHIAVLNATKNGYILALNRVSFNNAPSKLDLRRWKDDTPLKGVQLSDDEARSLLTALEGYFADSERTKADESGQNEDDSSC